MGFDIAKIIEEGGEPLPLDFFSGGVPPSVILKSSIDDLRKLLLLAKDSDSSDRMCEVGFVGALSYFEAFCKDHFGCCISIYPQLLKALIDADLDVRVDALKVIEYAGKDYERIGFLIAEKLDFGTSAKINSFYFSLLKLSPFSKDEAKQFSIFLRDRNLMVHHGGIHTSEYIRQAIDQVSSDTKIPFWNSRVIAQEEAFEQYDFLEKIAKKIVLSSHESMRRILLNQKFALSNVREKALEMMGFWPDDE